MHASQVILISILTSVLTAGATMFAIERLQLLSYERAREVDADVAVPSLIGLSEKDARANLSAAGLVPVKGPKKESDTVEAGHVAEQVPLAGQFTTKGTPVNYHLAQARSQEPRAQEEKEAEEVLVPKITGLNLASAKKRLSEAGLELGKVNWVHDPDLYPNAILTQEPKAEEEVPTGTQVQVRVNRE